MAQRPTKVAKKWTMNRSAVTGRTVSNKKLDANPKTTVREERALKSTGAKSKAVRTVNRSAITGKTVSKKTLKANPRTTTREARPVTGPKSKRAT